MHVQVRGGAGFGMSWGQGFISRSFTLRILEISTKSAAPKASSSTMCCGFTLGGTCSTCGRMLHNLAWEEGGGGRGARARMSKASSRSISFCIQMLQFVTGGTECGALGSCARWGLQASQAARRQRRAPAHPAAADGLRLERHMGRS